MRWFLPTTPATVRVGGGVVNYQLKGNENDPGYQSQVEMGKAERMENSGKGNTKKGLYPIAMRRGEILNGLSHV